MTGGISYPGDDGTEPPEVREQKAREYAEKVERDADARARSAQELERPKPQWKWPWQR